MENMDWLNFVQLVALPAFAFLFHKLTKVESAVEDKIAKHTEKTAEDIDTVRENVSNWQLVVVRDYATRAELERLENRIVGAIERLETKLDKKFEAMLTRGED